MEEAGQEWVLPFIVSLAVMGVVLAHAALMNRVFGHETFHSMSAVDVDGSLEQGRREDDKPVPMAVRKISCPPVTTNTAVSVQSLPPELLALEVLTYLHPYEVTAFSVTSSFMRSVCESSLYWSAALDRVAGSELRSSLGVTISQHSTSTAVTKHDYFLRVYSHAYDIAKGRNTRNSCYVVIHNKVYDLTRFLEEHPGGPDVLLEHAGSRDATRMFELSYHSASAKAQMRHYLVWDPVPLIGRKGSLCSVVNGVHVDKGIRRAGSFASTQSALSSRCPRILSVLELLRIIK